MITRVLIINRQLVFAVTIKQALEQTGAFEVHPFTDPNAAVEYVRTHPHDIALIDFDIAVMPGPEVVQRLREIQPEIAVIVSPAQPNDVLQQLNIQDTVDAPFSARGIIPVIERAVEQISKPTSAVTRSFIQLDDGTTLETDVLPVDRPDAPPATDPSQTRILDDDELESVPPAPAQTHILDDESESAPPAPAQTHILDDESESAPPAPAQTRILDDESESVPPAPAQTRILDDDSGEPPTLPEFSSLDDVLSDEVPSALFEPPVKPGDTPAVPDVDSDAVRQYLATSTDEDDSTFDDMLSAIPPDADVSPELPADEDGFDNLVNSMRAETHHTPLPGRHQQFVEFILTGGMDTLLSEIEQTQDVPTDEAPETVEEDQQSAEVFEQLAEDEPSLPTLEENGTVGDLMVGVSDTGFRNVLAMMSGEAVIDEEPDEPSALSREEIDKAYATFFEQEIAAEAVPPELPPEPVEPPPDQPPTADEPDSAIPAQLILETALDESTPVESFSLNDLIGDIERQLTQHQPDVLPLPSWDIESFQLPQQRGSQAEADELERYIKEPDFLPDALPRSQAGDDQSVAEMFNDAEDLSESDLVNLGRDLFDDRVSSGSEQQATARVDQDEPAIWDKLIDEESADYGQVTVAHVTEETGTDVPEPPPLPEDEVLFTADADLPDADWDDMPDDWEAEAEPDAAEPAVTAVWEALLDEESADHAQATVAHSIETDDDAPDLPQLPEDEVLLAPDDWEAEAEADVAEPGESDSWEVLLDEEPPVHEQATVTHDVIDEAESADVPLDDVAETGSDPYPDDTVDTPDAPPSDLEDDWELTIDEAADDQTVLIDRPELQELPVDFGPAADFEPEIEALDVAQLDDPYVAQIALGLTQMSLELAAEATLLTSEAEIVAVAGHLDQADIDEIRATIADDWDADVDEARVRFVTLPSSGKDYMLYSRKTVGDFTLSMIFAGTTPLRDIRRQGKRLLEALETVPETSLEDAPVAAIPEPPDDADDLVDAVAPGAEATLQSFTYLWLLRDPDSTFSDHLARVVKSRLRMQLIEMGWDIKILQAQDEYVYIQAGVPGEQPAPQVIDGLKRRVAEIIYAQEPDRLVDDDLWADSYLVMMPGRELDPEEISQFIDFERML